MSLAQVLPYFTFLCNPLLDAEKGVAKHTRTLCVLGRGPWGLAVARPMTGQANCRGLNHRVAQGFEHPTHGPFPPGLGWGWRSLGVGFSEDSAPGEGLAGMP